MRRSVLSLLLAAALLTLSGCGDGGALDPLAAGETGKVVQVKSGEEVVLDNGLDVRLSGVEAPWTDEPGGAESQAALAKLVQGQRVQLFYGGARRDRSGRALAQLRLVDGRRWVEGALLRDGMVRVRTFADNRALAHVMLEDEAQARIARRGLWAMPDYEVRLPQEVAPALRGFQIVEGRVLSVTSTRDGVYLDFTPDRRGFAVLIPPKAAADLTAAGTAPASLKGRLVRVRGMIDRDETMRIDHPEPIELIREK